MQIRNNYQIEWQTRNKYGIPVEQGTGIFNGDMGIIRELNLFSEEMEVEFDEGRMVRYSFKQADELELAYAITVHKSQGGEYPCVILVLLKCHYMMLRRNLLYTAMTRAKKLLILVAERQAVEIALSNNRREMRYSLLGQRLRKLYDRQKNGGSCS
jgi:exodeoxyribonuclease V alpha subunit